MYGSRVGLEFQSIFVLQKLLRFQAHLFAPSVLLKATLGIYVATGTCERYVLTSSYMLCFCFFMYYRIDIIVIKVFLNTRLLMKLTS